MKHLKSYKIFESNDNFLLDCKDILLELKDDGFDVQFNTDTLNRPEVNIKHNHKYTFGEILEIMLRLNDFLKLNNKKAIVYEGEYRLSVGPLTHVIKNYGGGYKLDKLTIVILENN